MPEREPAVPAAQICRLPFDAALEDGTVLARHQYLLSLKDNNQSGNLAELVAAGVRSFKIEGRLKDMDYVKNITAFYRKKLDAFLNTHPEYAKESVGDVRFSFTPDPQRPLTAGRRNILFTAGFLILRPSRRRKTPVNRSAP